MCLGSSVLLHRAASQPISIDKDSHVYRQAAHLTVRTFRFQKPKWMAQRGVGWGVLSFPKYRIIFGISKSQQLDKLATMAAKYIDLFLHMRGLDNVYGKHLCYAVWIYKFICDKGIMQHKLYDDVSS